MTTVPERRGFETRAIHAGQDPDPFTGAVVPPISISTTFAQQGVARHHGWEYSRSANPTRASLELCLASLEGGTARLRLRLRAGGRGRGAAPAAPGRASRWAATSTGAPSASSTRCTAPAATPGRPST